MWYGYPGPPVPPPFMWGGGGQQQQAAPQEKTPLQRLQETEEYELALKAYKKRLSDEVKKPEERGPLKGVTKKELFWIMVLTSPIIGPLVWNIMKYSMATMIMSMPIR